MDLSRPALRVMACCVCAGCPSSSQKARAVSFIDHVTVDSRPQLANSAACSIQLQTRLSRPRRLPLPPDPLIVFYYASPILPHLLFIAEEFRNPAH
jgi:hypothetical protein